LRRLLGNGIPLKININFTDIQLQLKNETVPGLRFPGAGFKTLTPFDNSLYLIFCGNAPRPVFWLLPGSTLDRQKDP
jgi:hypothetical protein